MLIVFRAEVQWWWTRHGVEIRWREGPRVLRYSQNLTHSLDLWPALNVSGTSVEVSHIMTWIWFPLIFKILGVVFVFFRDPVVINHLLNL
jgi:hypothetical protein